jgi:PTH1 family peptidyl-tRNA hydrolase
MRLPGRGAPSIDLLVAGLGNPERRYEGTPHNVGFRVIEELARRYSGDVKGKFSGNVSSVRIDQVRVVLLQPLTYMNKSGQSVGPAMRFYKLPPECLLVIHDEVDLPPGRIQLRAGGGLAGHNGLKSVVAHIKAPEFLRLRIGVGRPGRADRRSVADYVLSPFAAEIDVDGIVSRAADAVELLAKDGLEAAQRDINGEGGG